VQALIDNDVYAKAAKYGLLPELHSVLLLRGYSQPHGRLAAAPYKLSVWGRKAGRGWNDADRCRNLAKFFADVTTPVTGAAVEALEVLNVPFFDTGEIQLVARAVEDRDSFVMTGDKNAIRASTPALRFARSSDSSAAG
jgi:hypothetical protein